MELPPEVGPAQVPQTFHSGPPPGIIPLHIRVTHLRLAELVPAAAVEEYHSVVVVDVESRGNIVIAGINGGYLLEAPI